MGKVAAEIKVMPESTETDLDAIEEEMGSVLPDEAELTDVKHEEVAFGLTALIVNVAIPDDEGGTETVESRFRELDDVESVTVQNVGRV